MATKSPNNMASITIFSIFFALLSGSYGAKCPEVAEPLKHIVCYYEGTTAIENVNLCNCTHLIFSNLTTISEDFRLTEQQDVELLKKSALDSKNLNLLLSLNLKAKQSALLLKSDSKKTNLLNSVSSFLQTFGFSGVELNFEFQPEDSVRKEKVVSFVKDLGQALDHHRSKRDGYSVNEEQTDDITTGRYTTEKLEKTKKRLIKKKKSRISREDKNVDFYDEEEPLSVVEEYLDGEPTLKRTKRRELAEEEDKETGKNLILLRLSIIPEILVKKYDLKALSKYIDYFTVPTHLITDQSEDHLTFHPSRLMGLSDILNTDSILDLLTGLGAPKSRIIISMPGMVLKYQLKDPSKNTARSRTVGEPQMITQSKMCSLLKEGGWTVERDEDLTAPYAFSKSTWLAFEDEISANIKGKYVILRELAGAAIFPIDSDTSNEACAHPQGGRLAGALQANFGGLARKPRQVVLQSLQEQIHDTAFYNQEAGVHLSEYRIVRVVDHSGAVHVIRKNTKTEFECSRQGYFSHPLGCNKFYRCVKFNQYTDDYTVFEYDCPAGLAFDERWEVCVWPGSLPHGAPCTGSSEIAPVPRAHYACPNVEGYYADPENCRWFFACLDHARDGVTPLTAYEFRCPFGLVFDESSLSCEWPWKVGGCGARGAAGYVVAKAGGSSTYLGTASVATGGASYATVPDYVISGGRIANKGSGVILNQNVVGVPGIATVEKPALVGSLGSNGGIANGFGAIGLGSLTPSSLVVEDQGSKHRAEGGAFFSSTPTSFIVDNGGSHHRAEGASLYSSAPSSFLVEDGGSKHRAEGAALYSSNPSSILVENGGAQHRGEGGAFYASTPSSFIVGDGGSKHRAEGAAFYSSTPSSILVENGGNQHRGEGGAFYASTPSSFIVDDGGSKHRAEGAAFYSSTPSSILVENGGNQHRGEGGAFYSSTPSSFLVEDGGSKHRGEGAAFYSSTPSTYLVEDGGSKYRGEGAAFHYSTPSSILAQDGGASHRGSGAVFVSSTPSTLLVGEGGLHNVEGSSVNLAGGLRSPGYYAASAPSLAVGNGGVSKYKTVYQQSAPSIPTGFNGISYGQQSLGQVNGNLQGFSVNSNPYLEALRGRYGEKSGVASSVSVTGIGGYAYDKPAVQLQLPKQNLYGQKLAAVSTYNSGEGYTYNKPSVQLQLPTQSVNEHIGYTYEKPLVAFETPAFATTRNKATYEQNVQPAISLQPVAQLVQPVSYQQNIAVTTAKPIELVKPVVYQRPAISLKPTFYQQEIVTPRPVVIQKQYVTPKPIIIQQAVVTPKPIVYQQEISPVVQDKTVIYQRPAVSFRPTFYQKEIVTPRPVILQQQYVTPKPFIVQQEVLAPKPIVYQQEISPIVTPKPVVFAQTVVTQRPLVAQPVLYQPKIASPKPVIYEQRQQIVTPRPVAYEQKEIVYNQNVVSPSPIPIQQVFQYPTVHQQKIVQTVTPQPFIVQKEIAQPIVTPRPAVYKQSVVTARPVVYQQQYLQPIVSQKTAEVVQPIVTPEPVVYEQRYQLPTVTTKPIAYQQEIVQPIVTPRPVVYQQHHLQPIVSQKTAEVVQPIVTPKPVVYEQRYQLPTVTTKPIAYQQEIVQPIVTPRPVVYQQQHKSAVVTAQPVVYQQQYLQPIVSQKTAEIVQPTVTPKHVVYEQRYQLPTVTTKPIIYQQEIVQSIVTPRPKHKSAVVTAQPVVYQQQYLQPTVSQKTAEIVQPIVTPKPIVYEQKYQLPTVTAKPIVYQQEIVQPIVTPKPVVYQQQYRPTVVTAGQVEYQQQLVQPIVTEKTVEIVQPVVTSKPVVYKQQFVQQQSTIYKQTPVVAPKRVVYQQQYLKETPVVYKQQAVTPQPVVVQQYVTPQPAIYQQEIVTPRPVVYSQEVTPKIAIYERRPPSTPKAVQYQEVFGIKTVQPITPIIKYEQPQFTVTQRPTAKTYVTPSPIAVQEQTSGYVYEKPQQIFQEVVTPKPIIYQQEIIPPKQQTVIYQKQQEFIEVPKQPIVYAQKIKKVQPVSYPKPVFYQQQTYVTPKPIIVQQTTPATVLYQQEYVQPQITLKRQRTKTVRPLIYQQETPRPSIVVEPVAPYVQETYKLQPEVQYQTNEYLPPVVQKSKLKLRGKIETTPRTVYAESYEANPGIAVLQKEIIQPLGIVTTQVPIVTQYRQQYKPTPIVTSEAPIFVQENRQTDGYHAINYNVPVTEGSISTLANLEIQRVKQFDVTTARPAQQFYTTGQLQGTNYELNNNINIPPPSDEYILKIQSSTAEPVTSTRYTVKPRTRVRVRPVTTTEASREYLPPSEVSVAVSKPCEGDKSTGKATIVSIGQVDKDEVDEKNLDVILDKYSGKYGELSEDDQNKFVTKVIKGNGRGTINVGKEPEVSTVGYEITSSRARSRGRAGSRKFASTTTSTDGYETGISSTTEQSEDDNTDTADISLATLDLKNLKVKKNKKTIIVVSQVSDANPILIGKLAGQCSCESNKVSLRKGSGRRGNARRLPEKGNDSGGDDDQGGNLDNPDNSYDNGKGNPRGRGSKNRRPNDDEDNDGYEDDFGNGGSNSDTNSNEKPRARDGSQGRGYANGTGGKGRRPNNSDNENGIGASRSNAKLPSNRRQRPGAKSRPEDSQTGDDDGNNGDALYAPEINAALGYNEDRPLFEPALQNIVGNEATTPNNDLPVYIGSYGGRKFSNRKQPAYLDNIAIEAGPGSPGQINVQIYDDNGVPVSVTSSTTIIPEVTPSILLPIVPSSNRKIISDIPDQLPIRPSGRRIPSRSKARKPFVDDTNPLFSPIPADEIASTIDYSNVRPRDGANDIPNESSGEPSRKIAGAAFDRYGPGGWRSADETLQGSVDCKRPGLFRHPKYCNKFYACNYDSWKKRYTLHVFNCPVHLAYDSNIGACNWPSKGPACADDNLLV